MTLTLVRRHLLTLVTTLVVVDHVSLSDRRSRLVTRPNLHHALTSYLMCCHTQQLNAMHDFMQWPLLHCQHDVSVYESRQLVSICSVQA